eukprot:15392538-Heterocapsa_arctica.AAC.1
MPVLVVNEHIPASFDDRHPRCLQTLTSLTSSCLHPHGAGKGMVIGKGNGTGQGHKHGWGRGNE